MMTTTKRSPYHEEVGQMADQDLPVSAAEPSVVLLNLTQPHSPGRKSDCDDDGDDLYIIGAVCESVTKK